jgi:hypothetical protein
VAAHDWAMWRHNIGPINDTCHILILPLVYHRACMTMPRDLPRAGPYPTRSTLYGLYSQQNFACLAK